MLPTTIDAVKAILRADPTVTPIDRVAIIAYIRNHGKASGNQPAVAAPENRIVRCAEVARRLGRCTRTVHRLVRQGVLRSVTLPGRKRTCGFLLHEVERFFAAIATEGNPPVQEKGLREGAEFLNESTGSRGSPHRKEKRSFD